VGDFVEHTRAVIDWLRGRVAKPEHVDASTVKNIITFVEPTAKDAGSNISVTVNGDNNFVPIVVSSLEANAMQNGGARYLESLKEPKLLIHEKKLMSWHQVRNEDGPATGEKAIIEAITNRPIKVIFDSKDLRDEMLYGRENPLKEAYLVDVEAQTVRGKIAIYKVLRLHDRVPLDGNDEPPAIPPPPPAPPAGVDN
jgi:hypothetical protein